MQKNSLKWMAALAVAVLVAAPASAQYKQFFFDGFDTYADYTEAESAGWQFVDANNPESDAWWSLINSSWETNAHGQTRDTGGLNIAPRHFPATFDGTATGVLGGSAPNWTFPDGMYMISDGDARNGGNQNDDRDSGQSHDLVTPIIDCSGCQTVWVHFDCSAVLNDNGKAVFMVDVTKDGDMPWDQATWETVLVRVAPDRGGNWNDGNEDSDITTYRVDNTNADGYFGRMSLDLSQVAAGEENVRIRWRHYEQDWDWWIAIDNVLVNNVPGPVPCDTEIFSHNFDAGAMAPMVVEGTNQGTLATWTTEDPNDRYGLGWVDNKKVNRINHATGQEDPNFAIVDENQIEGQWVFPRDEWLKTPVLDCSNYAEVVVDFESEVISTSLTDGTGEDPGCVTCAVTREVVVSIDGGQTWETLFNYNGGGSFAAGRNEDPFYAHRVLNAPQAAGQSEVVFAWHYQTTDIPNNAGFWAVDNVRVTGCTTADFDSDNDGVADLAETGTGVFASDSDTGSDVKSADSDGDGWTDGAEVAYGGDPNDPNVVPTIPEGEVPVATFAGLAALAGALVVAARRVRK